MFVVILILIFFKFYIFIIGRIYFLTFFNNEYKLMFLGKQFLKIDKWFPSSKTCSKCGNVKKKLELSERSYKCECCGIEIDRDYNAALNIKNIGKAMLEY